MRRFKKLKEKTYPSWDRIDLFPEKKDRIYGRHLRGAWIRSGSSLFMWFFALIGYRLGTLDVFSFIGICCSVLFLILINPPALWLIRHLTHNRSLDITSLAINAAEVLSYTAIIYFSGGLGRSYLTLLYPALIVYVGIVSPGHFTFIVAGFCSLGFSGIVLLEYFQIISKTRNSLIVTWPISHQILDAVIISGLLLVTAFISSFTSRLLKNRKTQLRKQNMDLQAAMERAQISDRMKSEFLANMSHEFRTPLNHIIGFSEMLSDRQFGPLNSVQEEYLGDILKSGHHLLSLINNILELSKSEAEKMDLDYSEIPFQSLLENSLATIKEKAGNQRLNLQRDFSDIPPVIQADEQKVKQILYYLLSNAVKFTPEGGTVLLTAKPISDCGFPISESAKGGESQTVRPDQFRNPQSAIQISVTDTGIGLAKKDLERIFNPFEQVEDSLGRKYQGTGLGLSLARRLVEMHGGLIWAVSNGEGQGSRFHFTLPLQQRKKGT